DQLAERFLHAFWEHDLIAGRLRDRYVATHGGSSFDLWRIAANAPNRSGRGRRDRRHIKVLRGSGQPPLPGATGPLDLSSTVRWHETRTGFVGAGLPAAHQHVGGIPSGTPVSRQAPLFMGFTSNRR